MKIKKIILSLTMLFAFASATFANDANPTSTTATADAMKEITSIVKDIEIDFEKLNTSIVNVQFMINANNEIVVLRTSSDELDRRIKGSLNYTELKSRNLEINKVYILPIKFEKVG